MTSRRDRGRRWLVGVVVVPGALLGGALYYALSELKLPVESASFAIRHGSSLRQAAQQMTEAKVLRAALPFELMGRALGKATGVRAGNYEIRRGITAWGLLVRITSGAAGHDQITFIEGWPLAQARAALDKHPAVRHDTAGLAEAQLREKLAVDWPSLEGAFFPDTYYFANGTRDLDILRRAHRVLRTRLNELWNTRAPALPLATPYEALVLASIVEKETGSEQERAAIAAVFINRLKRGMLLQTDPTVIYGLGGSFDGNLRKKDLVTDTPYNTYTRGGLPPTPIALPGLAALTAALHPASSDALYFVARGDGTSQFSRTLAEHERAVAKYQKHGAAGR